MLKKQQVLLHQLSIKSQRLVDRPIHVFELLVNTDWVRLETDNAVPDKLLKFVRVLQPRWKFIFEFVSKVLEQGLAGDFVWWRAHIRDQVAQAVLVDQGDYRYKELNLVIGTFWDC